MEIEGYVRSLGGQDVLVNKINEVIELANQLCPEEIVDFFLSEYRLEDGRKKLDSLWLFSPNFILESKDIRLEKINIDLMWIKGFIDRYEIDYSDFKPSEANDESSLSVLARIENENLLFQASGLNCNKLWDVFEKFIKPSLWVEE